MRGCNVITWWGRSAFSLTKRTCFVFQGFLALEGELTPILVQMVKSANMNGLLDNDNESSKFQNMWVPVQLSSRKSSKVFVFVWSTVVVLLTSANDSVFSSDFRNETLRAANFDSVSFSKNTCWFVSNPRIVEGTLCVQSSCGECEIASLLCLFLVLQKWAGDSVSQ